MSLDRRQVLTAAAAAGIAASTSAAPGARTLPRLGRPALAFSLGGEGVLRTVGREKDAVPVILEALRLGVRYCDTAPAYSQSQDYYGAAFREAGAAARDGVTLASKTHDRTKDGSLRLLDDSLRRLATNRLDLWQLHDLRSTSELDRVFAKGGAIEALERARAEGRVKHLGITGHHDPAILLEAIRRYDFDAVLCPINPADPARLPFLTTVVPAARAKGTAVIAMKVFGAGEIVRARAASPETLLHYAASHADTAIIGCSSVEEVRENFAASERFAPMPRDARSALEARLSPHAGRFADYKRS